MTDTSYQKFVKRWQEVTEIPPQNIGFLTPIYKKVVKHLKAMPWPHYVFVSLLVAVGLYFLAGSAIVLLASILQRGF